MNARTRIVIVFVLLLFFFEFVMSVYGVTEYQVATYRQGFIDGCRAHDVYMAEDENGWLPEGGESFAECVVLWAEHEHDEGE